MPRRGLSSQAVSFVILCATALAGCSGVLSGEPAGDEDEREEFAATTYRIWPSGTVPAVVDVADAQPVELGVKFRADSSGSILGIRFFKSASNKGTHTGSLWSRSGVLLARAVFTKEGSSGWQRVLFASPVAIEAGATYVASYHTEVGHYSANNSYFAGKGYDRQPLHALADGQDGPNGVYKYGASGFPTNTWRSTNYWVDVVFAPSASGQPTADATPLRPDGGALPQRDSAAPRPDQGKPDSAPAPAPNPGTLTHGKNLTLAMVGPAAIGITTLTPTGKGDLTVYDASSASFIKQVSGSASYEGCAVSGAHLLIQGVSTGSLDIYATQPTVIRGSSVRGGGYWAVNVRSGAGPVCVLYSEVGGTSASSGVDYAIGTGGTGKNVFLRNHITYGGDGFSIGSKNDQILENYVEKFYKPAGAHNDGLQATGGNDGMVIARNKIILDSEETGAINLGPWGGAVAQYVTVDANYLAGGGYTFYGGSDGSASPKTNHVVVTNNVFGFDVWPTVGYWGVVAYWYSGNSCVWSNNTKANGTAVNP